MRFKADLLTAQIAAATTNPAINPTAKTATEEKLTRHEV
jgi:hypothetical protein